MGRNVSIAISAKDNYTQAITTMRNANSGFNKDLEGLTSKLNALNNTKATIKVDVDRAKSALKDAERQFLRTGDAADEMAYKLADADYENARRNLDLVSKNAKQAEKDILSLTDAVSRSNNRADGGSSDGLLKGLAAAGVTQMVGKSLTDALSVGISSAFGSSMGNAISTAMNSAISGAAMGSMAGPVGTLVGGLVGAVAGGISGASSMGAAYDEIFKSERNQLVQDALAQQAVDLETGIDVAMGRQKTGVQLRHMFGSEEKATKYLEDTINLANLTPFFYDDLIGVGSTYKSFGYSNEELYEEQLRVADAAAIRGWDTSGMEQVASTLGFMRQSGKIDTMRVKQLQRSGLNIPRYLAIAGSDTGQNLSDEEIRELLGASEEELKERGIKLSEDDIYKMIESGQIDGKQAARAISDYMALEFEGGALKLSETYYGLESTLGGLEQQIQNAMGEGYTEARMPAIQEQINWLSGDSGEKMQEANRLIGEWRASLDNNKERIEREHMDAALQQIEEAGLTGAKAGEVLAQAQINAQAEYAETEGANQLREMEKNLLVGTANTLKNHPAIYEAYYELGQMQSKGILDGMEFGLGSSLPNDDILYTGNYIPSASNHAYGLPYVPYDGYMIRAHEGERLLTAADARKQDQQGAQGVVVTGNEFIVRQDSDIDAIAQAIYLQFLHAQELSG